MRYEADIDLEAGTSRCNCTYCGKLRAWNTTIKPHDFRLLSGKDDLSDYQFGSKQGHHRFCRTCGVASFGEGDIKEIGGPFVSINVACLDDMTSEATETRATEIVVEPDTFRLADSSRTECAPSSDSTAGSRIDLHQCWYVAECHLRSVPPPGAQKVAKTKLAFASTKVIVPVMYSGYSRLRRDGALVL